MNSWRARSIAVRFVHTLASRRASSINRGPTVTEILVMVHLLYTTTVRYHTVPVQFHILVRTHVPMLPAPQAGSHDASRPGWDDPPQVRLLEAAADAHAMVPAIDARAAISSTRSML
jgi:hypothetical protein